MYFRWSGYGWLGFVVIMLSFTASLTIGGSIFEQHGLHAAIAAIAVLFTAIGAPATWLLGFVLNSKATPNGRYWHDRHTAWGAPVQKMALAYPFISTVVISIVVGQVTATLWGWLTFALSFGAIIGTVVAVRRRQRARRLAVGQRG